MRKVNKSAARKAYNEGKVVYLIPCKARVGVFQPVAINIRNLDGHDFDATVNTFEYYNCCADLGAYAHYYLKD